MNRPSESELHAYADGRLRPERAAQVAAWLREHGDDAALVDGWKRQKDLLRAAYGSCAAAPAPDRAAAMVSAHGRRQLRLQALPRLAAVIAWLAVGAVLGFLARDMLGQDTSVQAGLPRHAAIAHVVYTPEVRHPVEVGAEQEAHLAQWLSRRLGGKLAIPDLGGAGFRLVGGRLLPAASGPAAQFMYENSSGLRLTLYVRKDAGQEATAFRYAHEGRVAVFYWIDGGFGYALSGELERETLLRLANLAYAQLVPR